MDEKSPSDSTRDSESRPVWVQGAIGLLLGVVVLGALAFLFGQLL